jgi:hypothetical protein
MNAASLISSVRADGLKLAVSEAGTVKLSGPRSAVDRWAPVIASNKPGVVALLRQEAASIFATLSDSSATRLSAAETLLLEALHAGVEIRPIGGKVTVTGVAPPELQARLAEYWDEILSLFSASLGVNRPGL